MRSIEATKLDQIFNDPLPVNNSKDVNLRLLNLIDNPVLENKYLANRLAVFLWHNSAKLGELSYFLRSLKYSVNG